MPCSSWRLVRLSRDHFFHMPNFKYLAGIKNTLSRVAICSTTIALLFSTSCSFAPKRQLPEIVTLLPQTFVDSGTSGEYNPRNWWQKFRDPTLDAVIEAALAGCLERHERQILGCQRQSAQGSRSKRVSPGAWSFLHNRNPANPVAQLEQKFTVLLPDEFTKT